MLSAASGAIMSAFLVIEQVAKPLVWVLLGLAGGVATDRSRWMSKGFLSLLSSIAWAATLSRPGILSPLLCSVAVVIGSRLRVVGLVNPKP
ncbi:hypothetical protein T484DRAFT_3398162 [Baffinella frigidus]|nr:hypothetical protein T484DRAFT_3398162 [Cryptophyta sp. CCMP2293]